MFLLVVDDDALSRDLLALLLEAEGYEIEVAASGEDAVARLAACAGEGLRVPDIILTDVQMPGLAGDALARILKPLLPAGTLLLAMSGSQPAPSGLTGFDGFLLKPFQAAKLSSMISGTGRRTAGSDQPVKTRDPVQAGLLGYESGSILDEEIYEKMSELMPVTQLGQMYALCLDDARKRISLMQTLAAAEDDALYRSEAHAVKGGCGMIGALELYELAAAAESHGLFLPLETPGTGNVKSMLAQLAFACDRLERILQERTLR